MVSQRVLFPQCEGSNPSRLIARMSEHIDKQEAFFVSLRNRISALSLGRDGAILQEVKK